jgi:ketosteroid isomerase-like protein
MLALLSVGCNHIEEKAEKDAAASQTFNLAAAKDSIEAVNTAIAKAVNSGDTSAIPNFYTSDAVVMPANMPALSGVADISSFFSEGIRGGMKDFKLEATEVYGNDEMLTEVGTYTLSFGPEKDKGKYIVIWKKEGGKWKLFRDIFNSDNPPPPMPEAAKK